MGNPIVVESSFLKMLSTQERRISEALEALDKGWVPGVCFNGCGRPTFPEDKIDIVLQSPNDWNTLPNRVYCVECVKIKQPKLINGFCSGPKRWSYPGSIRSKRSRR